MGSKVDMSILTKKLVPTPEELELQEIQELLEREAQWLSERDYYQDSQY